MSLLQRVPPDLISDAKLHQRLALSGADFKHAVRISKTVLRRRLHEKYRGINMEVLRAMNCSMVLAYTRPFSGAQARRNESIPALPGKILRLLTEEERKLHDQVMRSRNKFLAHTDADAVALETFYLRLPSGNESLVYMGKDRMEPLDVALTKMLGDAAEKLYKFTQVLATDLESRLKPYFRVRAPHELFDASDA